MKQIRKRLTYANVMSSLAIFLILGGATAFAAIKKVGAKEIKANSIKTGKIVKEAVTSGKIKKGAVTEIRIANGAVTNGKLADNSVTNSKIANDAVTGNKIADGAVSGADINSGSTPFSRVVDEIRGTAQLPATAGLVYPFNNPTYTQQAGEDNQFVGAADVTFQAGCTQPRTASMYLLADAANPAAPTTSDIAGFGTVTDTGAGTVSRSLEFVAFAGTGGMSRFEPPANTQHTFNVFVITANCTAGSGITITGAGVDVIGTK